MSFLEFKSSVLRYAGKSGVSVLKIFHDEEKGLNVAILPGLKITGNSSSRKVTIHGANGRKFMTEF